MINSPFFTQFLKVSNLFTLAAIILLVLAYVVWTFWYLIRLRKKEDALFENQEIINWWQ